MRRGGALAMSGPFDQTVLEMGNNLLIYSTDALTQTWHIFGQARITLYAATSASSADLVAKLVKVTAAGRVDFICIGIARSWWLFGEDYEADKIQCWRFTLEPTSVVLQAGESLRLEIASSAFPLYDRNSSSEVPPQMADQWSWKRSTQQILHTAQFASALHLPIIGGKLC